jgi:putative flippase GtrA
MLGTPVWLALIGGNVAGIVFNFITTGGLVFEDLSISRAPRFVLAHILIYLTNLTLIHLLVRIVHRPIVAQALLVVPLAVASYLTMSRFVYRTAKKPKIV